MTDLAKALRRSIVGGIGLVLLVPLVIVPTFFFPFITGKGFFARAIIDVIFGLYIALALLDVRFRPKFSRIGAALTAFTVALTLSTIFGVDAYRSFWSNFERMEGLVTILHMFALFVVAAHVITTRSLWRNLLGITLGVSVLSALYGLLQMSGSLGIVGDGRPAAGFGNSIYFSVYLMIHMMLFAYLAYTRQGAVRWWSATGAALMLVVFSAAGSRGAFLGIAVAGACVFLWAGLVASSSRVRGIMLGTLALGAVLTTLNFAFPHNIIVRDIPVLDRLSATNIASLGDDSRVLIWKIGMEGFIQKPLFGWGIGNFIVPFSLYYNPNLFTAEPWFDRAHNMFIEWLVTAGIVGFVAYMSIFFAWAFAMRSLLKSGTIVREEGMLITALIVSYGVQNAFVFEHLTTYLFIALLSAYLVTRGKWDSDGAVQDIPASSPAIIGAALAVIFGIVLAVILNAKPMLVAGKLITSLDGFSENLTGKQIEQRFADTIALGSFGQTEVRERLADTLVTFSTKGEVSEQYIQLLDYAISEYEKELTQHEPRLRDIIFTGKLHSVRYVVSKQESSRARAYELYKQAIVISPNYLQGRLGLSEVALASGDFATAKEQARIVYDKVENKDGIFYPAVSIYLVANDASSALGLLGEYTDPDVFNGFDQDKSIQVIARALSILSAKDRIAFLETYEQAWRDAHPHGVVYLGLAQTYGELGRIADAERAAKRAAELTPDYQKQVDEFLKAIHGGA